MIYQNINFRYVQNSFAITFLETIQTRGIFILRHITVKYFPGFKGTLTSFYWSFLFLTWVKICDFRFVDCANFLLQASNGHTKGLSPVWIRTCVRKLKSSEKRFPQPSNVHCQGKTRHQPTWQTGPESGAVNGSLLGRKTTVLD